MNGFSTNQSCFIAFQKSVNLIETRNNFALTMDVAAKLWTMEKITFRENLSMIEIVT